MTPWFRLKYGAGDQCIAMTLFIHKTLMCIICSTPRRISTAFNQPIVEILNQLQQANCFALREPQPSPYESQPSFFQCLCFIQYIYKHLAGGQNRRWFGPGLDVNRRTNAKWNRVMRFVLWNQITNIVLILNFWAHYNNI